VYVLHKYVYVQNVKRGQRRVYTVYLKPRGHQIRHVASTSLQVRLVIIIFQQIPTVTESIQYISKSFLKDTFKVEHQLLPFRPTSFCVSDLFLTIARNYQITIALKYMYN